MLSTPGDDAIVENSIEGSETAVEALLRLTSNARFIRSADGRLYAQVPVGGRHEIYGLKSPAFRDWLIESHFRDCDELPSPWAVRRVLTALEARARFDGGPQSVFIRVGRDGKGSGSAYYLDLGDPSGRAIQIRTKGWSVVDRPGVHFRRPDGQMALPMPGGDGSIELLRPYVNLNDPEFRLVVTWLAAALRPVGPYPILALRGEQGSAKSTLATIIQMLIDPQESPLLAEPKSTRDLMVTAIKGWLLAYDNISVIPDC